MRALQARALLLGYECADDFASGHPSGGRPRKRSRTTTNSASDGDRTRLPVIDSHRTSLDVSGGKKDLVEPEGIEPSSHALQVRHLPVGPRPQVSPDQGDDFEGEAGLEPAILDRSERCVLPIELLPQKDEPRRRRNQRTTGRRGGSRHGPRSGGDEVTDRARPPTSSHHATTHPSSSSSPRSEVQYT